MGSDPPSFSLPRAGSIRRVPSSRGGGGGGAAGAAGGRRAEPAPPLVAASAVSLAAEPRGGVLRAGPGGGGGTRGGTAGAGAGTGGPKTADTFCLASSKARSTSARRSRRDSLGARRRNECPSRQKPSTSSTSVPHLGQKRIIPMGGPMRDVSVGDATRLRRGLPQERR